MSRAGCMQRSEPTPAAHPPSCPRGRRRRNLTPGLLGALGGICLLVGACSVLPKPEPPPKLHDLGPPPAALLNTPQPGAHVTRLEVEAAPWLSSDHIYYRRLADTPTHLHRYANNRWVAPMPALLRQRIELALTPQAADGPAAGAPWTLRVSLQLLEQRFRGNEATAVLRATATLVDASGQVVGRRTFERQRPCAATVDGAVSGLSTVITDAVTELAQWIAAAATDTRAGKS